MDPQARQSKIPDPDKYDGNRDSLQNFLLQLRLKALDDQSRLRYAISLLKDRALSQIRPYVRDGRVELDNLEALISKLNATFGDPDRKATAERKLMAWKQGSKDFSTFFAEFSRYAADLEWNDIAKRGIMRSALCYELKVDLIAQIEPEDFDEWIALLQRLDNKRRQIVSETTRSTTTRGSSSCLNMFRASREHALFVNSPVQPKLSYSLDWIGASQNRPKNRP